MTDRELLELAAKAGGIQLTGRTYCELYETADQEKRWWNPLQDDGDALRLAADLKFSVIFYQHDVTVESYDRAILIPARYKDHGGDRRKSARQAITCCAAEVQHKCS